MVDASHPFFADPTRLGKFLSDLHPKISTAVEIGGASGTFSSASDRMEGYVVTRESIAGVWADRSESDRITRAVFYRVVNGQAVVEEFENVNWSYWDLVERGRDWLKA
jgi:hypothetical protein